MRAEPTILPLVFEDVRFDIGGRTLVEGLSFTLDHGGLAVLMGPNGAGKSITLRLAHGLIAPTSGRVAWQGPGAGLPRRGPARHAMVFQKPVLLRRSVRANLLHALALAGFGWTARRRIAAEALERFGLGSFADEAARTLSGGEQQRLAIARAWSLRPDVIFLDEPTAHLDPAATRQIESMIQQLRDEGTKLVLTTHDLGQARRLADQVLFLHRGRLLEQGPAANFFAKPTTVEATAFLAGELTW